MTVTEIALLRLHPSHSLTSPKTLEPFRFAISDLQSASSYPFRLYASLQHDVDDRQLVYLIGSWKSTQHHKEYLPSERNQHVLKMVKDVFEVLWMFHLNLDHTHAAGEEIATKVMEKEFLKIGVFTIDDDATSTEHGTTRTEVENLLRTKHDAHLDIDKEGEEIGISSITSGWKILNDGASLRTGGGLENKDELVIFTGFDSIDQSKKAWPGNVDVRNNELAKKLEELGIITQGEMETKFDTVKKVEL